jgi:hypothetical protein
VQGYRLEVEELVMGFEPHHFGFTVVAGIMNNHS